MTIVKPSPIIPAPVPSLYPPCEDAGKDCRFISGVSHTTCLHSPLEYNREGQPVGGGRNTLTKILHCTTCNSNWVSKATEMEDLVGKARVWTLKP